MVGEIGFRIERGNLPDAIAIRANHLDE